MADVCWIGFEPIPARSPRDRESQQGRECASLLTPPWQQGWRKLCAVPRRHASSTDSSCSRLHNQEDTIMLNANVPAWFEIPASRLDRAQNFYETILGVSLKRESMGGGDMAVFPYGGKPNTSGALIQHEDCEPSVLGSTVYLNVSDLRPVLERVLANGGDSIVPRTELPGGMGFFAQFIDSEGNRVGLYSPV
jgi:predicted enzyme related to lactoylglutathione lyase